MFRVLRQILIETYKDLLGDLQSCQMKTVFWEHVFFRLLPANAWEIPTVEALKSRFGWILEYVIEGQFPKEAGCVRNALQQALL